MRKSWAFAMMAFFVGIQAHGGDPLRVVRDQGFYKTGAAAKNTNFVKWLKKPVFGEESAGVVTTESNASSGGFLDGWLGGRPIKRNAALETIRDQGYKDKEARMRSAGSAR